MIDIIVATCERLPLLQRTLACIWERTTTPYRLHVIDDASTEGNAEYLRNLQAEGRLASVHLHKKRGGIVAHLRALEKIATSDPLVFTDDDVLCPRMEPDWLARGLEVMGRFPQLGLLALNNPQCNLVSSRGKAEPGEPVTLCRNVGGTFLFVRRAVLAACQPAQGAVSPIKSMCLAAGRCGWRIGYLTRVYCQHIGAVSVRRREDMSGELERVLPIDGDTLEPPDAYKG